MADATPLAPTLFVDELASEAYATKSVVKRSLAHTDFSSMLPPGAQRLSYHRDHPAVLPLLALSTVAIFAAGLVLALRGGLRDPSEVIEITLLFLALLALTAFVAIRKQEVFLCDGILVLDSYAGLCKSTATFVPTSVIRKVEHHIVADDSRSNESNCLSASYTRGTIYVTGEDEVFLLAFTPPSKEAAATAARDIEAIVAAFHAAHPRSIDALP